jgi:exonuclease III
MTGNNRCLLILTLNVNGLNAPIKRHRIANWVKKNKTQPYVAYKRFISLKKNKHLLRLEGWEKVFHVHGPHKQAEVAILISDKVDFRLKSIRRHNEGHFVLMKGTTSQEKISVPNMCTKHRGTHLHLKK